MEEQNGGEDNRELYALLNLSPEASDEEIRKAYRQWAQVYHPDKYQDFHMKDIVTENFQRICEAYEILSDSNKRQIYDIYGMEGLNSYSGFELGLRLDKAEEIKAELERSKKMKKRQKLLTHFQSSGTILANMSVPHFLDGDGLFRGNLSSYSAATMGIAMSLRDGSLNLSNLWTRQLSETASGHIQIALRPQSSIAVGWQKKDEKRLLLEK
ncbi:hypothetical protein TanjilG_25837 [Lupinus angustifolius]|uniref:J domain-containing protein n=1 Tax=Lupinus angustifolius TaxID=3871 RepID=A0A1J7G2D2_LUPAN|nr:PREDICTED: chaperone protein dnaJ 13-like [Lupinus angustifolius]OIV94613.1 hypothetical protein TanjilG_25837 [Lupinus angustifolius]